jgi:glycosyltransferase involved in cell wall biosynthesis
MSVPAATRSPDPARPARGPAPDSGTRAGLFVSWAPFSRRTESLARLFDLDPRFVSTPWPKRPLMTPIKYPWQAGATVRLLRGAGERELWVMDPPSPLVAMMGAAARRRGSRLVVDMHTVAFFAREWLFLRRLELPALRRAAAVLVTNEPLARQVRSWGARAFVLPDPLPEPPAGLGEPGAGGEVTVVATYSKDEPLDLLPEVARRLPDVRFAVTGDPQGDLRAWPRNLRPTGFLSDEEYWRQLQSSAAVVVLTTRPDTLLSGGYEALVLERPLVTSGHRVLREYFGDAAVYAGGDAEALAGAVVAALADDAKMSARLRALRVARAAEWDQAAGRLRAALGRPEGRLP